MKIICESAFGECLISNCAKLEKIIFKGTKKQWKTLEKHSDWDFLSPKITVVCSDGEIKNKAK